MSALQTLRDLRTRGFQFQTGGQALAVLPKESLSDSDRSAIRSHEFELIKLLTGKFSGQDRTAESHQLPSKVITKWHSRGARLWLGTTTHDGLDYRTLEYEFFEPSLPNGSKNSNATKASSRPHWSRRKSVNSPAATGQSVKPN